MPTGKKHCDEALIAAIAAGGTVVDAARNAQCSETTARRRMKDPVFVARLKAARSELLQRTVDRLATIGTMSADVLYKLLSSGSERIRMGAAKNALALLFRGKEVLDHAAAIEELQRVVAQLEAAVHGTKEG